MATSYELVKSFNEEDRLYWEKFLKGKNHYGFEDLQVM